ncbi:MAG TPA: site-2 protease family protein [Tepidisphaeraceae bacterium]
MGWQDRSYYRDSSRGASNPLMWLLTGSVPLFTAFGIRVRMHASLLILLLLTILTAQMQGGMGMRNALTFDFLLFGIILLHEFGHCFAARSVGGDAKEILMWPLGGLAFADAPNRAWPQLVTTAGGPLVNVLICLVTAVGLVIANRGDTAVSWNPLSSSFHLPDGQVAYFLWFIFIISWGNLLFNLLPIFPMDGGRLLQEVLWFRLGYYRSMIIALTVGIVGAALMTVWGLVNFGSWYGGVLLFLGVSCLWTCYATRAAMRAEGPWAFQDEDGIDYSASLFKPDPETHKHKKLSRRVIRRVKKREEQERAEQEQVDRILAKVSAHGMHSLTWWEKRTLHKATDHQRKRDTEVRAEMKSKGF